MQQHRGAAPSTEQCRSLFLYLMDLQVLIRYLEERRREGECTTR